ncbi:MAG TPA: M10 family metallopeptidase C-terminal domain-containing protein [Vitreimonas sp.]|uniref:M10 family metallopeptidase C-terminal domain-containing protein n=1 Tax=Vitreimonas sp. TaxID=3069702 RepID=UPI002D5F244B|nr:M10 family metallopeptidase C-terminal domain-containing protein [Vitreimonas sp.]HYD88423.1 M10 family metallopeptidase C-terminal domain-containing protein [Vitreimonas sp.]
MKPLKLLAYEGAALPRMLQDRWGEASDWGFAARWAEWLSARNEMEVSSAPLLERCLTPSTKSFAETGAWCGTAPGKFYDAMTSGTAPAATAAPAVLLVTGDAQPGDTSTTATLEVNGAPVVATIDTLGDFDFFRVELTEGQHYEIGQYLKVGGPSGVPLSDAYLELYDAQGNLLTAADGGGPNTPSGLDALLTFQASYTGTYYVNARAFDQDATNGANGDAVGDYELFVRTVEPDPTAYVPRYSIDSPLHSIDWGSQIDRTSRNPDGDNGPRDNGAPNTGVVYNATYGIEGKNVVTYYFAKTGDVFIDEDPATLGTTNTMVAEGFQQWEKDAFRLALDQFEQVADVIYLEVQDRADADLKFVTYEGTPGAGASLLGRMSPPNEDNEGQAEFNAGDARWTQEGLQQGGYYFPTLLHEFAHGHGMAHPHDDGGESSIMRGAGGGTAGIGGALGDFNLSQQVFTIMSYNDGWQTSPYGQTRSGGLTGTEVDHYGWMGTLAALDIAVIQDKYGVNEEWATGDDVYTLKDVNGAGTFYSTIWDAGGADEIKYVGDKDATIDLRPATLQYEEGGGGRMSYAYGVHGGFTIANGVTIEKASGGNGADTLIGNAAANTLSGGEGADQLTGGAGADVLNGGAGADTARYDTSSAGVKANLNKSSDNEGDAKGDSYVGIENLAGSAFADTLVGDANANTLSGLDGGDALHGGAGLDALSGGAGDDRLTGGEGADTIDGGEGFDTARYDDSKSGVTIDLSSQLASGGVANGDQLINIEALAGSAYKDLLSGDGGANHLFGLAGADLINGREGNDVIYGGAGFDELVGGLGADEFVFKRGEGGRDSIYDFDGSAGDMLVFSGYGTEAQGASFTQIDETHWMINSADGRVHDVITLTNGATIDASDYIFGP